MCVGVVVDVVGGDDVDCAAIGVDDAIAVIVVYVCGVAVRYVVTWCGVGVGIGVVVIDVGVGGSIAGMVNVRCPGGVDVVVVGGGVVGVGTVVIVSIIYWYIFMCCCEWCCS